MFEVVRGVHIKSVLIKMAPIPNNSIGNTSGPHASLDWERLSEREPGLLYLSFLL